MRKAGRAWVSTAILLCGLAAQGQSLADAMSRMNEAYTAVDNMPMRLVYVQTVRTYYAVSAMAGKPENGKVMIENHHLIRGRADSREFAKKVANYDVALGRPYVDRLETVTLSLHGEKYRLVTDIDATVETTVGSFLSRRLQRTVVWDGQSMSLLSVEPHPRTGQPVYVGDVVQGQAPAAYPFWRPSASFRAVALGLQQMQRTPAGNIAFLSGPESSASLELAPEMGYRIQRLVQPNGKTTIIDEYYGAIELEGLKLPAEFKNQRVGRDGVPEVVYHGKVVKYERIPAEKLREEFTLTFPEGTDMSRKIRPFSTINDIQILRQLKSRQSR